ncbi:C1-like protein [Tanacetum coccineum]
MMRGSQEEELLGVIYVRNHYQMVTLHMLASSVRITRGFSYFVNEKDDKGVFTTCSNCCLVEFARKVEADAIKEEAKIKFEHKGHPQHSLTLKLRPGSFHCDACNAKDEGLFYECDTCDFWIHKSCATLAPTISIHLPHHHPKHPLVLVYSLPDKFYRYPYFSHIKCALNAQQLPSTPRDDPRTSAASEYVNSLLHFPMSEALARDDNFNSGEPIECAMRAPQSLAHRDMSTEKTFPSHMSLGKH